MIKTFNEWIDYSKSLHASTIDLNLQRVKIVATQLKVIRFACPVVLVGGTNGKGSCVACMEAIYRQAGFAVGTYTSPHFLRYQEQVKIKGAECSDEQFCAAFNAVEQARADLPLTFFEFFTLASLRLLQRTQLDIVLLEIGMGGKEDAVNVVEADLSIVTSIAMDHVEYLGSTRDEIAWHKAHIYRAHKPAICGDVDPPPTLLDHAKQINTKLFCVGRDFNYEILDNTWSWSSATKSYQNLPIPHLDIFTAAIAIMGVELLAKKLSVSPLAIAQGIAKATLPGRFQRFSDHPTIILDVAHNVAACENLVKKIKQQYPSQKINIVVGMLKDKDIENCLACFLEIARNWYVASLPGVRGENAARLGKFLVAEGVVAVKEYQQVQQAFAAAKNSMNDNEILLVFGSFLTVAEIFKLA